MSVFIRGLVRLGVFWKLLFLKKLCFRTTLTPLSIHCCTDQFFVNCSFLKGTIFQYKFTATPLAIYWYQLGHHWLFTVEQISCLETTVS